LTIDIDIFLLLLFWPLIPTSSPRLFFTLLSLSPLPFVLALHILCLSLRINISLGVKYSCSHSEADGATLPRQDMG